MSRTKMLPLTVSSAAAAAAAIVFGVTQPAWAQDPTFNYADDKTQEELAGADKVEWRASAQAGLILTTGNSGLTSFSGGAKASRKANQNKFELEAGGTFARSTVLTAVDSDGDGQDDDGVLDEDTTTTNELFFAKARYDRFLTDNNSLYATGSYLKDEPAGKDHVAGAQLGYSRLLYSGDGAEAVSEIGYDLSFEVPVGDDGVLIHSARVFVGYTGKLSEDTGVDVSVEGLFNINSIDQPDGTGNGITIPVDSFEDTRVNAKLGLTTKLFEDLSFRFSFQTRFDNAPSYLKGVQLESVDTRTEATIILNIL